MKRPSESDYTSLVAYTRALEAYCDAKRKWVGLTDEDLSVCGDEDDVMLARYWERILKEKNT